MAVQGILASAVLSLGTFQRVLLPHTPIPAAGLREACLDVYGVWRPHVPRGQRPSSEGGVFSHSLANAEAQR